MAGGLFNRAFQFNEKCIIFSIICMALFLIKPTFSNNLFLYLSLFLIFVVAYVAMAWYDYYFNCDIVPLRKGKIGGITAQLKPKSHVKEKQEKNKDTKLDISRRAILIYSLHLFLIVPLLLYIGIYKNKVSKIVYPLLVVMAIFTAGYHGMSFINKIH
mgnify:CR=1 FL=1